ncbi:stretch-activated Ca2+-permeable channel component-domain-containing protein [Amylocarpus encephaloides]|uniref:Stretch-activated Ca2+-permeable channel component-domain-containing protein n=1 Tax=Amylocarpus encephaloides TaxID=45428 RepID=A0A9P8C339_9HELO|nr:stretch-activated Ca2+-permeable channel component-domain-containing protein [Amylocarpus encephaloides]
MPFPKLSPLQSRLAASLAASLTLLFLYFAFSSSHFAYASNVDSIRPEDHNHERLLAGPYFDADTNEELLLDDISYESEFLGVDRGIIGRAPASNDPIPLMNNIWQNDNVPMGTTVLYIFTNASVWGNKSSTVSSSATSRRQVSLDESVLQEEDLAADESGEETELQERQASSNTLRTVYISVTTCGQPTPIDLNAGLSPAPQLQLYVSVSADNKSPGPGKSAQSTIDLDRGYGMIQVNATGDVYIGVHGKNATAYTGVWNVEIAASIDAPYHYFHDNYNMSLMDSDSSSVYFVASDPRRFSRNTSDVDGIAKTPRPYVLFASKKDASTIYGLQNSGCGLESKAEFVPEGIRPGEVTSNVQSWLSLKRDEAETEQRFSVSGLAGGTYYNAILAIPRDANKTGTVGGGGQVFRMAEFTTLSDSNCAVVTNLTLCDKVSYAVPSGNKSGTALRDFYENYTNQYFGNFLKALQQIPCNTTSSAQYSLATNCTTCREAYKDWFCAVSIPRCANVTDSTRPGTIMRNVGQDFPNGTSLATLDKGLFDQANQTAAGRTSRNSDIDNSIVPGPYRELLPCDDLCYNVVRNCPAALGFNCPQPGNIGFNTSYSPRFEFQATDGATSDPPKCNFPGAVERSSGRRALLPPLFVVLYVVGAMMFI